MTRRCLLGRAGALASAISAVVAGCQLVHPSATTAGERTGWQKPTAAPQSGLLGPPGPSARPSAGDHVPPTAEVRPFPDHAVIRSTIAPSYPSNQPTSGQLNYLRAVGSRILDASGRVVLLTGLNWFGMETDTLAPHGLWARSYGDLLDQIVELGYNCLRLPFSSALFDPGRQPNGIDYTRNPDLKGLNGLEILDTIIVAAGRRGLKIILDQHRPDTAHQSPLWYTDHLSTETWIAQWQALARRYLGNDAVIGADLHNEPSGPATWGTGDPQTDWASAAEECGNAILDVNPNWLILVEGIEKIVDRDGRPLDWTWQGGELMGVRQRPVHLRVPDRIVYSPHDYGLSVYNQRWFTDPAFPDNLPSFWDQHWGYIAQDGIAPVLVGEFGGPLGRDQTEDRWQETLVSYLRSHHLSYTYWCLNPNSADTGGLLEDDWKTVNRAKQDLLKRHQGELLTNAAPEVVHGEAVPPVA